MLYCFIKRSDNANDIADEICSVYASAATLLRLSTIGLINLFGNFDLKDEDRNGHPAITDYGSCEGYAR